MAEAKLFARYIPVALDTPTHRHLFSISCTKGSSVFHQFSIPRKIGIDFMLSSRGAISNDQVMLECTGTQEGRDVFLLSELERVWAALSAVVRDRLLEGHNTRVAHFGSFWFETCPVVSDGLNRYFARRLRFGIDAKFALRYGLDVSRVPLEPPRLEYVRPSMADVVALSSVPARTAEMALREFFSYIGEGLFRQRLFQLAFPGVARVVIKRERAQLDVDAALRREVFAIDARKWPAAVRAAAEPVVLAESRPASASSRPSTRCAESRPCSAAARPLEPRPAFVAAAPRGRLFADIGRDPPRRAPRGAAGPPPAGADSDAEAAAESVFDALGADEYPQAEPEIECVEEMPPEMPPLRAYEEEPPRPAARPSMHGHSSVRDLIYGKAQPQVEPITQSRRRYINRDSDGVAELMKRS